MLVTFSIIPIGSGSSISSTIAEVMKIIDASGLSYRIHAMGTVVEGSWDELLELIKTCHETALQKHERVYTSIAIDDRKGKAGRIETKIQSVEAKIGKHLKK